MTKFFAGKKSSQWTCECHIAWSRRFERKKESDSLIECKRIGSIGEFVLKGSIKSEKENDVILSLKLINIAIENYLLQKLY